MERREDRHNVTTGLSDSAGQRTRSASHGNVARSTNYRRDTGGMMDIEHAIEIAEESKAGGYDSPTELALQFLAEFARNAQIEKLAASIVADRRARLECAEICERVWSGPYAKYRDGAQVCEELI